MKLNIEYIVINTESKVKKKKKKKKKKNNFYVYINKN